MRHSFHKLKKSSELCYSLFAWASLFFRPRPLACQYKMHVKPYFIPLEHNQRHRMQKMPRCMLECSQQLFKLGHFGYVITYLGHVISMCLCCDITYILNRWLWPR